MIRPKGSSLVIGNSAPLKWAEKYLRDDYGAKIYEEYTMTEWEPEEGEVYKNELELSNIHSNQIEYHPT